MADLEATTGAPFAIAVFRDRSFHNFRDERFGETADFRMNRHGGRERTEDEYRALLKSAGLSLNRIVPTRSPVSVIEAGPL